MYIPDHPLQVEATSDFHLDSIFTLIRTGPECVGPFAEFGSCLPTVFSAFNGKVVFACYSQYIGLPCIDRFSHSLEKLLTKEVEIIILSLKDVKKLSRTAVGCLVDFAAGVLGRGKKLYLYKPSPVLEERFRALQLMTFFKTLHSDDAITDILPLE